MYAELNNNTKYIITKDGVVFDTFKSRIVAPFIRNGYQCVRIQHKNFYIHRLLAEAFIPNPENKPEVNHKDGRKLNNRIENLEWCTYSDNIQHAYNTGLRAHRATQVKCIETGQIFDSVKEAESFYGIKDRTLYRHLEGRAKHCHNLHWKKIGNKPKVIIK